MYDDTNRGALFKNDRKESDKHPDYKGPMNFNGQDGWMAAWLKKDKNGRTYMSLSWQPKDDQRQSDRSQAPQGAGPDFNDEIPFSPF